MVDASKAALAYLAHSGAAAISVIADVDGAAIRVGFDAGDADVVEVFWIPAAKARSIAARACHIASPGLEVDDAVAAIRSAAAESRTTITLHDVAIARAAEMASALDRGRRDASERPAQSLQSAIQGAAIGSGCQRSRLHVL